MAGSKSKTVVLGVSGGIAAYKAAELCRLLVKAGAAVRVVMTDAAAEFIAPLTLQTLSGAPVARSLFDLGEEAAIGHIRLADEAGLIVVAPATADVIARIAAGMANDLLSAVVLASRAPVLLAPAMNVNMWENPLTQQNLARLVATGRFHTVGPDAGPLACGWIGAGRLIEPAEIAAAIERLLAPKDLDGRRVVVTAGPTFEPIDDVRFLGNRSSGRMGFAIAAAAARRGAAVTLIAGPVELATPAGGGIARVDVQTADEMRAALARAAVTADAVVMAAAVADFRPAARVAGKLSRRAPRGRGADADAAFTLPLVANPDLLAELGRGRRRDARRPFLVGFAAESGGASGELPAEDLASRGKDKLREKGCDVIVANDVGAAGIGFGGDDNAVTMVFADGGVEALERATKAAIADGIWDRVAPRLPAAAATRPARGRGASATGAGAALTRTRTRAAAAIRPAAARATATRGRRA